MHNIAQEYVNKGWTAPFPLPVNDKYPPVKGATGGIPEVKLDQIKEFWNNAPDNANLGLRAQIKGSYEVIAIDIDHYDSKRGNLFFTQLEEELGSLDRDSIPRSTRRGVNSESAQYFFLVPKGQKWKSTACPDVEIVQLTHRYSAVYPSTIDGKQYQWYCGKEEIGIPEVSELPKLPENWVRFLKKGARGRLSTKSKPVFNAKDGQEAQYRQAYDWLRDNLSSFDLGTEDRLSEMMINSCRSDRFREALKGNAHDNMVSAVHSCVMLAVEGHVGLKAALRDIKNLFVNEVTLRSGKSVRSKEEAIREYRSAVIGEVEKLIADVNSGNVRILNLTEEIALPNFGNLLTPSEEAEKRPKGVDFREYGNTDRGNAYMFFHYWGQDVLATRSEGLQEFASWTPKTGRYTFRGTREMFDFIEFAVSQPLEYEAEKIEEDVARLAKIAEEGQLGEDMNDPDELQKLANSLRKRANMLRNTSNARQMLAQLHSVPDIRCDITDFDTVPGLIGGTNSRTLDLKNLLTVPQGEDPTRPSLRSDMLTMATAVSIQHGANHEAWQAFLDKFIPDKELQRFAQKVFGYALVDNNPAKLVVFLWGPSNTGKTTILEAIGAALGDYAGPMNAQKLFGRSNGGPNPEILNSMHKRMVYLSEVGDGHELSANTIKQVSGNDKQQARMNHSNEMIDAVPMFVPYISTNNPPAISHADEALRNRVLVLPFNESHPPTKISPEQDLKKNKAISSAILWWVIEGCKMYLQEGLLRETWPEAVRKLSDDFLSGVSTFQTFRSMCIVEDEKAVTPFKNIYNAYRSWCLSEGVKDKDLPTESKLRNTFINNGLQVRRTTYQGKPNTWIAKGYKVVI